MPLRSWEIEREERNCSPQLLQGLIFLQLSPSCTWAEPGSGWLTCQLVQQGRKARPRRKQGATTHQNSVRVLSPPLSSSKLPLHVPALRQTSPTPVITQASAPCLPQCQEHKGSAHNANYAAEAVIFQQPGCSARALLPRRSLGAQPSSQDRGSGCQQMPRAHSQGLLPGVSSHLVPGGLHPSWLLFWSSWGLCSLFFSIRQNQPAQSK